MFYQQPQYPQYPQQSINLRPLMDRISEMMKFHVQNLVQQQQLSPFQGTNLLQVLQSQIQPMAERFAATNLQHVDPQIVDREVYNCVCQVYQQMMNQQQGQAYRMPQQPLQGYQGHSSAPMNFEGAPSFSNPKQQSQPMQNITQPPSQHPQKQHAVQPTTDASVKRSISPEHRYNLVEDKSATSLSTTTLSGQIVSVIRKSTITDDENDVFNYCKAVCHVPEPSISRVVNNFISTNPKLCQGKWIIDLDYTRFIMKNIKARTCSPIDLSYINDTSNQHPVNTIINNTIQSICERDHDIVLCISEIFVKEFNDLSKRYIRLFDDMNHIIKVETITDIKDLAIMRDKRNFGELQYHRDYENTVLRCFKETLFKIVIELTRMGYYNTKDIVSHMLACPSFVVRGDNLCEREMDIDDENFINAVANKYTAFAYDGNIVVSNFIPDVMLTDVSSTPTIIDKNTNVFDMLITSYWDDKAKTILMQEPDNQLIVKTGKTMDGVVFVYKDTVDMTYGL